MDRRRLQVLSLLVEYHYLILLQLQVCLLSEFDHFDRLNLAEGSVKLYPVRLKHLFYRLEVRPIPNDC